MRVGSADSNKQTSTSARRVLPDIQPRALNLHQAATYIGVSYWTMRDYALAGLIPVIEMPPLRAREGEGPRSNLRRVLVDVRDLDAFLEAHKTGRAADVESRAPGETASTSRRSVPAVCPNEVTKCAR